MRRMLVLIVLAVAGASMPPAAAAECTPGEAGCMPSYERCASGGGNGVWLGRNRGAATACVAAEGQIVAYAGGNPTYPCGTIAPAGFVLPGADQDPNRCDTLAMPSNELRFRVQLPSDYETSGRAYPVLYLLPGGGGDENTWFEVMDVSAVADQGLIVVSPHNGVGMYNDWRDGRYQLETLFVQSLVPHVDSTYRTVAQRGHRAIAGFSQGGYGAMFLSARHPELFAFAASLSGVLDIRNPGWGPMASGLYSLDGGYDQPYSPSMPIFGDYVLDEVWWRDRNPLDLAANLRGTDIRTAVGNGIPAQHEASPLDVVFGSQPEMNLNQMQRDFVAALDAEGIGYHATEHDGGHLYQYGAEVLREWVPHVLANLGRPDPAAFDYRTVEAHSSAWGWSFTADPARAPEFLEIRGASSDGFHITGSGMTRVVTGRVAGPGATVEVTGAVEDLVVADEEGRLHLTVDLGPPARIQQYRPGSVGQDLRTAKISF
ncbi:MAG TPA: alpha/beta hydrolase family protein [Actinomycetota bacterium]|nr:alpha/beta hydrolase family protein [Actinomycetota bacterium]